MKGRGGCAQKPAYKPNEREAQVRYGSEVDAKQQRKERTVNGASVGLAEPHILDQTDDRNVTEFEYLLKTTTKKMCSQQT